jgi:hypothetical protein
MRERAEIKKGEDKSAMVSSLITYPVRPAMQDESRDDVYSDSKCLPDIAGFQASLFLRKFILSKRILL